MRLRLHRMPPASPTPKHVLRRVLFESVARHMRLHVFRKKGQPSAAHPLIYAWDIETAPNVVHAHDLVNERPLPTSAIKREKYIICGSWQDVRKKTVHGICVTPAEARRGDDKRVVKRLHAMISSADAVVAHYGDAFDMRTFNARALKHGLKPIPPVVQIDTWKIARKKFKLNSNRLDYLGQFLGLGRKLSTGIALWDACMAGSAKALRAMLRYNKQDVRLLTAVYLRLRPYIPAHVDASGGRGACKNCGEFRLTVQKYPITKNGKKVQYQCQGCGAWDTKALPKANKKRDK